jgi:hypothetical protein
MNELETSPRGCWPNLDHKLRLTHCRIGLDEANAFVAQNHRHHKPVVGHLFSLGASDGEKIVGVAIVGRPVSRFRDDGETAEVTRLCTDGTKNACSFLYGAAAKAAFALGFKRIGTYTLPEEGGGSLRGAGWKLIGERGGGSWSVPSRPRVDKHPTQMKLLWEAKGGGT